VEYVRYLKPQQHPGLRDRMTPPAVDVDVYNPYSMACSDATAIDIALDPELLTTFCRRGRRRLRDIQSSCQAAVKLDRARGVLRVVGPESSIHAVRRQLASLGGPRRSVPAAVWAELMRTRTMRQSSQARVARLQQESGCRVHIERSRQEVRLFGPGEGVAVADKLLEELATLCTEEAVPLGLNGPVASPVLQALAHSCSVTLRVEERQVVVLGLRAAVANAVEELKSYLADPQKPRWDMMLEAVAAEAVDRQDAESSEMKSGPEDMPGTEASEPKDAIGTEQHGVVTTQMPPPVPVGGEQRAPANHKPFGPMEDGCSASGSCRACPTCGAGRFCVFCGAPTWQVEPINLAAYASLASQRTSRSMRSKDSTTGGSSSSKPGTPDSEQLNPPWVHPMQFMPYDGSMTPNAATGMNSAGMVPQGMVPVCFPANMVQNGGQSGGAHQGVAGTAPSVMQACMVPAAMMQGACMNMMAPSNENNIAFCAMPAPYVMQEGGVISGL